MSSIETHDYNLSIWMAETRASGQPSLLSKLEGSLSYSDSVSTLTHPSEGCSSACQCKGLSRKCCFGGEVTSLEGEVFCGFWGTWAWAL